MKSLIMENDICWDAKVLIRNQHQKLVLYNQCIDHEYYIPSRKLINNWEQTKHKLTNWERSENMIFFYYCDYIALVMQCHAKFSHVWSYTIEGVMKSCYQILVFGYCFFGISSM